MGVRTGMNFANVKCNQAGCNNQTGKFEGHGCITKAIEYAKRRGWKVTPSREAWCPDHSK